MINNIIHNPNIGDSDHEGLTFDVECSAEKKLDRLNEKNYFKADYKRIKNRLGDINWDKKLRGSFLDSCKVFMKELEGSIEGCIPT